MTANATVDGSITATGGENCDLRGFEWGYISGTYTGSWTEAGSFGTGSFSHKITGLDFGKRVYFRAKAHNSAGWAYGTAVSFETPGPSRIPWLKTRPVPREVLQVIVGYYKLKGNETPGR